ncbi:MAG: HAD family hydrolase [Verrucomicrobiota bacterium]
MKISAIIFDLGKVLVDFDFTRSAMELTQNSGSSVEDVFLFVRNSSLIAEYSKGRMTSENFFKELKEAFDYDGTVEELQQLWCDIFTPMDAHIQLAKHLAQYYPLAILSNTDEAHIQFLESRHDFFDIFQEKIYSFQVGYLKPAQEIYQIALERMKTDRFETLFIDDVEENIIPPSKMGWQTIHLRPDVSLKHALQSYDLRGV